MRTPSFPGFPSEATSGVDGRVYRVHDRIRCVAYHVPDTETFRRAGAVNGSLLYSFIEVDAVGELLRVGVWHWAPHPDDLLDALEGCRAVMDPAAPQPKHSPFEHMVRERLTPQQYFIPIDVPEPEA